MPTKKKTAKKKQASRAKSSLTAKRIAFAFEYSVDKNGKQAAIRAGYSAKTAPAQACELLKVPEVKAIIKKLLEKQAEETQIDAKYVLIGAHEMFERCMQREEIMEKVDGKMIPTGEWKFDSSGAGKSLKLIGDHVDVQAFKDNVEVNASKELLDFINSIPSTTGPPSER